MKLLKLCFYLTIYLIFLQNWGLAQKTAPISTIPSSSETISEQDLIHLGDLIEVDVVGSIEYDWRGTLNPEGFLLQFDKIEQQIFALCKSEAQVAQEIEKHLSKMLREPKVIVKILDRSNRPVSIVSGAVKKPHRFQIKRRVYLNELIVLTGGFTEQASGEIEVFRPANQSCGSRSASKDIGESASQEKFISTRQDNGSQFINIRIADLLSGKKEANLQIFSGDIVTVLEASPIYVIGGVANPKQILARSEMTLSRAIASVGGLSKNADPTKVMIFRRKGRETSIIEVNMEKIKSNQTQDIVLQAFDIVEVSQKGREKRKFPPVLNVDDREIVNPTKMPLLIVD
jgi:protein involved in polysaccharide export with SLBB domain